MNQVQSAGQELIQPRIHADERGSEKKGLIKCVELSWSLLWSAFIRVNPRLIDFSLNGG
jgi:hypothetical protein